MGEHQRFLNDRQNELNRLLSIPAQHAQALELFLQHHGCLHAAAIAQPPAWSFEDEVLADLTPAHYRSIPPKAEHSIAWNLWHLARIEDTAMNLTVHLPDDLAMRLSADGTDLSRRALEAFAAEEYRAGRLTKAELRRLVAGAGFQIARFDYSPGPPGCGKRHFNLALEASQRTWRFGR